MKKHWQVKPWLIILVIIAATGAILYSVGGGDKYGSGASRTQIAADYDIMAYEEAAPMMIEDYDDGEYYKSSNTYTETERMMIKSGNLSMVVEDVRNAATEITKYTEEHSGFLVSSNINENGINVYGEVTVRVPSDIFTDSIDHIKEMGETENEYIYGEDITEEYTDLEAQLTNLEAAEDQFLEIMNRAVEIEDVLAVQRELNDVRQQIEWIEGRMKYMDESVDMSKLTIYLSTDPSELPVIDNEDQWKPIAVFKEAVRSLIGLGQTILNGIIWAGVFLPVIIVVLLIGWGIRKHHRK